MKSSNIFVSAFLVLTLLLATVSFAVAESGEDDSIDDVFSDDSSLGSITDDSISSSDILVSEEEIESSSLTGDVVKKTITRGSGWIITNGKGALLDIQFISGHSSDNDVSSKGWIKAGNLKFKIYSTSETAESKDFTIIAKDGSVKGTLSLKKGTSYQTGFGIWDGNINLNVGSESFKAEVKMALEEKTIGNGKSEDRSKSTYSGGMELGGVYYTLEGKLTSEGKIDLNAFNDKAKGSLVLEMSGNSWIGKIDINGDSSDNRNRVRGKATAELKREAGTLYGPIKVELDGSNSVDLATLEGTIKLAVMQVGRGSDDSRSDPSIDATDDRKGRGKSEDRSQAENADALEGKDNSESSERGFWKRFFSFFGGE